LAGQDVDDVERDLSIKLLVASFVSEIAGGLWDLYAPRGRCCAWLRDITVHNGGTKEGTLWYQVVELSPVPQDLTPKREFLVQGGAWSEAASESFVGPTYPIDTIWRLRINAGHKVNGSHVLDTYLNWNMQVVS